MEPAIYKIEAFVRLRDLETVQEALADIDVDGMTVTGSLTGRGADGGTENDDTSDVQLELFVAGENLDATLTALRRAAFPDGNDAGKVIVLPLNDARRISTGERGPTALS